MVACCCLVDRLLHRRCLVQPAAAGIHEPPAPPACARLTVQINRLPLATHIPPCIQQSAFTWDLKGTVRHSLSRQMHAAHTACEHGPGGSSALTHGLVNLALGPSSGELCAQQGNWCACHNCKAQDACSLVTLVLCAAAQEVSLHGNLSLHQLLWLGRGHCQPKITLCSCIAYLQGGNLLRHVFVTEVFISALHSP